MSAISAPVIVRQSKDEDESQRYIWGKLYTFRRITAKRVAGVRFPGRIEVERFDPKRGKWVLIRVFS